MKVCHTKQALIVVDMPFGTYEESPQIAFRNAVRIMKETNCGAVKLEGGARMAETIHFLVERGIPVMGHIGLNPNSPKFVKQYGNLLQGIEDAVEGYAKDVKSRAFPTKDQTYQIKK